MRTKIVDTDVNHCEITLKFASGEVANLKLFAPVDGGYVRVNDRNLSQVCERLAGTGNTLTWSPKSHPRLSDLIRQEYRRLRRAERKN